MSTDWRLISDDPPPLNTGVLVSDGTYTVTAEKASWGWIPYCVCGYEWEWHYFNEDDVKWWTDLPEPPGKEKE